MAGTSRRPSKKPAHLGLETTRGRVRNTVLRAEPCLFALYTLVVWLYLELPVGTAG